MARTSGRIKKNRDTNRRVKKRVSILTSEKIQYVDWKNGELLRKFMSERAKIRSQRVTGNSTQQQKLVADAIKLAREMAIVPYANQVTTQRHHKEREVSKQTDEVSSPAGSHSRNGANNSTTKTRRTSESVTAVASSSTGRDYTSQQAAKGGM